MQCITISTLKPATCKRATRVIVRAEGEQNKENTVPTSTADVASPQAVPVAASATVVDEKLFPDFGELMNFSGMAPEITNGRLAMLGFVAALGAELASQETVAQQFQDNPLIISLVGFTLIFGSLYPMSYNRTDKQLGPFTKTAEMLNGRAAMIGLVAMIVIEFSKGSALF